MCKLSKAARRGERVTFLFRPGGQDTPKALHVSPLMDMKGIWCARGPHHRESVLPGEPESVSSLARCSAYASQLKHPG